MRQLRLDTLVQDDRVDVGANVAAKPVPNHCAVVIPAVVAALVDVGVFKKLPQDRGDGLSVFWLVEVEEEVGDLLGPRVGPKAHNVDREGVTDGDTTDVRIERLDAVRLNVVGVNLLGV